MGENVTWKGSVSPDARRRNRGATDDPSGESRIGSLPVSAQRRTGETVSAVQRGAGSGATRDCGTGRAGSPEQLSGSRRRHSRAVSGHVSGKFGDHLRPAPLQTCGRQAGLREVSGARTSWLAGGGVAGGVHGRGPWPRAGARCSAPGLPAVGGWALL